MPYTLLTITTRNIGRSCTVKQHYCFFLVSNSSVQQYFTCHTLIKSMLISRWCCAKEQTGSGPSGAVQVTTAPNTVGGSNEFVFNGSTAPTALQVLSDCTTLLNVRNSTNTEERFRLAIGSGNVGIGQES